VSPDTLRQALIEILTQAAYDARELSRLLGIPEKDVYGHLAHVARSLAARGGRLRVIPARCLGCGFIFRERQRLTRPGRCPRCRKTHIQSPLYRVE